MSLPDCARLTYGQIWSEFQKSTYPGVTDYEKLQIHKRWKSLGLTVRKSPVLK